MDQLLCDTDLFRIGDTIEPRKRRRDQLLHLPQPRTLPPTQQIREQNHVFFETAAILFCSFVEKIQKRPGVDPPIFFQEIEPYQFREIAGTPIQIIDPFFDKKFESFKSSVAFTGEIEPLHLSQADPIFLCQKGSKHTIDEAYQLFQIIDR